MSTQSLRTSRVILYAASAGMGAALIAAFAGWISNGSAIFLTLAENGMSWCL
ncbi:hypothetical protein MRS76_17770 [Rhizobiaceae bacterium n13]|uniref:hypothetical protein n=1 Tax=Ferirhizobium litorale TaxID=2927786 RepID=UPI0024B315BA|nr:hypothetical protein [Fererhizobium litorale]MDI7863805.1 hypothetical protein [Fererhizobium litorale]